jgi:hypothetical protein
MSIRRVVFHDVGGFPDGYIGTAVYNETDFCCRVRAQGWRIVFRPDAEIFHLRALRGGCGNRVQRTPRPYYSICHNGMLFALRCLPWSAILLAIGVRWYEAVRLTAAQRHLAYAAMAPVATAHAVLTWLRTGSHRYPPPPASRTNRRLGTGEAAVARRAAPTDRDALLGASGRSGGREPTSRVDQDIRADAVERKWS